MRNKVDSIRLSRLSTNTMSKDEEDFVKEQLESLSKTQLVRRAIRVLYKHETGKLYKETLNDIRQAIGTVEELDNSNADTYNQLNNMIDNIEEFGR